MHQEVMKHLLPFNDFWCHCIAACTCKWTEAMPTYQEEQVLQQMDIVHNYNYFCQVWRTVLTWTIIRIGRGTTWTARQLRQMSPPWHSHSLPLEFKYNDDFQGFVCEVAAGVTSPPTTPPPTQPTLEPCHEEGDIWVGWMCGCVDVVALWTFQSKFQSGEAAKWGGWQFLLRFLLLLLWGCQVNMTSGHLQ